MTSEISASRSNRLSGIDGALALDHADDQVADLRLGIVAPHARQALEIEPVEQLLVDPVLEILIVRAPRVHAGAALAVSALAKVDIGALSCGCSNSTWREATEQPSAPGLRFFFLLADAAQIARKRGKRRRELAVAVENDRTALVHRLQRQPVVARERVADVDAHRALDILVPDFGSAVGTREHQIDAFLPYR